MIVGWLALSDDDVFDDACVERWTARATVIPSPIDASINVSFDPAPACYRFNAYKVWLVMKSDYGYRTIIDTATLHHPRNHVC